MVARTRAPALLLASLLMLSVMGSAASGAGERSVLFSIGPVRSWRIAGVGYAAAVVDGTAYIGGEFRRVVDSLGRREVVRQNLAAFDVETGRLLTTFRADTDGVVRALASDGHNLYVGGEFRHVNGIERARLAAVDLRTGHVRLDWRADASSHVYGLSVAAGQLFVAGAFSRLGEVPREHVGSVRLRDGSPTGFAPFTGSAVSAIVASHDGSSVYIGGAFTSVDGQQQQYLAKLWADGTLSKLPWETVQGPVMSLDLSADGSRLAAGIGGEPDTLPGVNQGALFDTSTGDKLWRSRCDGDGQAVQIVGRVVYSGFHDGCHGDHTVRVTAHDFQGVDYAYFTPWFRGFWGVWAIAGSPRGLVVAGDIKEVSGVPVGGFAIFPPSGSSVRPAPADMRREQGGSECRDPCFREVPRSRVLAVWSLTRPHPYCPLVLIHPSRRSRT